MKKSVVENKENKGSKLTLEGVSKAVTIVSGVAMILGQVIDLIKQAKE